MAILTNILNLETSRYNTTRVLVAKQGDSSARRIKAFFIGDGRGIISIDSTAVVTMTCKHAVAGTHSITNGTVNADGSVTVTLDNWVLALEGDLECSISAVSNGAKLSTTQFFITVQGSDTLVYGILIYTATTALSAGTYYVTIGNINYQFTTSSTVPVNGNIYFNNTLTESTTYNAEGAVVQSGITVSIGSTGTHLNSDVADLITHLEMLIAQGGSTYTDDGSGNITIGQSTYKSSQSVVVV